MDINPTQAAAHQGVGLDEGEDFCVFNDWYVREAPEKREDLGPALQPATGKLSHDETMTEYLLLQEKAGELPID